MPGEYKIFINIKDKDSQRTWQIDEKYTLESFNVLGPTLPFINNADHKKDFAINLIGKTDTVWLRTQVYLQETIDNQINYFTKNDIIVVN